MDELALYPPSKFAATSKELQGELRSERSEIDGESSRRSGDLTIHPSRTVLFAVTDPYQARSGEVLLDERTSRM